MHSIHFISAILRGKWLVDPIFAISQGSLISSILNNNLQFEKQDENKYMAFAVSAQDVNGVRYSWKHGFNNAPRNSVAVIPLSGPLMKEDMFCGPLGTATIGAIIKEADASENIDGIVLRVDSPGGTVDGTEALATIVKNTKKPLIAFVDGLMASAALWIGSSANEIMASTDTDEIGSVGVMSSFSDMQPYWEKKGVKFHTITASTSTEKVKMWEDVQAGKYETYIKEVLDPIDEKFMNVIKQNRPNVEDKHLSGKIFFARDVMGVFVDSLGTLEDAIQRVFGLAVEIQNSEPINSQHKNLIMDQFTHVNAVLGVESLESVDGTVSLNEEQLEQFENALMNVDQVTAARDTATLERDTAISEREAAIAARETAVAERETAVTERTTAEENLQNALAAFDAIDATVAEAQTPEEKAEAVRAILAAKPGAAPSGIKEGEDPIRSLENEDWETIDALDHNKEVDINS